jgi:DNA-3-methyladenine glycosylase II
MVTSGKRSRQEDFSSTTSSTASTNDVETTVHQLLEEAGITTSTRTKSGWCLREGLIHVLKVDNARLVPFVRQQGLPLIYTQRNNCRHEKEGDLSQFQPQTCFQSLCRIVAGQQLAGAAARTVWNRLLETTKNELTPATVLKLVDQGIEVSLQKPSGLSGAKARAIHALARSFQDEQLTEIFLKSGSESAVREALLQIKGIGPWSCDMFLMFYLEQPNVFPVGDLGVRKGMAKYFDLRGKGKGGALCPKKDLEAMQQAMEPYQPFQSLVTYYMWKVADTKDFYGDDSHQKDSTATPVKNERKKAARQVTPTKASILDF